MINQADIVWFVNCRGRGWVIGIEPIWYGSPGVAHLVEVNVRLVSFALSGVRNDLAFRTTIPCITLRCPVGRPSQRRPQAARCNCSGELPQRSVQIGKPVDFGYSTLQRMHGGCDVLEEMFVPLDQAEKAIST